MNATDESEEWRKAYLQENAPVIIGWLVTAFILGMFLGAGCFWFGLRMALADTSSRAHPRALTGPN